MWLSNYPLMQHHRQEEQNPL